MLSGQHFLILTSLQLLSVLLLSIYDFLYGPTFIRLTDEVADVFIQKGLVSVTVSDWVVLIE